MLFPLPRGAGLSSGAAGESCAVSVEDADRPGAFVARPCVLPAPAVPLLLPRGAFGSCLEAGLRLPDAFGAELGSAGVFSSSCAGACGATNSKNKKIQINRTAKTKLPRAGFISSPFRFDRLDENIPSTARIGCSPLRLSSAELRPLGGCNSATKQERCISEAYDREKRRSFRNADPSEFRSSSWTETPVTSKQSGARADENGQSRRRRMAGK